MGIQGVARRSRDESAAGGIESDGTNIYNRSTRINCIGGSKRLPLFRIMVELFGCLLGHCER